MTANLLASGAKRALTALWNSFVAALVTVLICMTVTGVRGWPTWVPIVTSASLVVIGGNMLLRPRMYIGVGANPARDPRTVRYFGAFFLLLGGVAAALVLIQILSE